MRAGTLKTLCLLVCLASVSNLCFGQQQETYARRQAIVYADSLVTAFQQHNSQQYIALAYPGFVHYYGGHNQFGQYLQRCYQANADNATISLELVQLKQKKTEWQAVVRKSRHAEGSKVTIFSYLIGQSTDNGRTWKYADIGPNSGENIRYIMPDIFDDITIPGQQVIDNPEQLARQ